MDLNKQAYLEIGDRCHCSCVMCNAHLHKYTRLKEMDAKVIISELVQNGYNHIRLTGREPCTHPSFTRFVNLIKFKKAKVDLTTTLLTTDPSVIDTIKTVDRLRVSLFAVYDSYQHFYRVNKWSLFMHNIMQIKNDVRIKFTYTLTEYNGVKNYGVYKAFKIIKFVREAGLNNYVFEFFPDFNYELNYNKELMYLFLDSLNAHSINFKYYPNITKSMNTCTIPKLRLYIRSNGDVYPCCNAGGEIGQQLIPELKLGNIYEDSIKEMSEKVLTDLDNPICNNCTQKYHRLMEK